MALQIQVISKETIKPSSPTPEALRDYKFSLFDQFGPGHFLQRIFFYLPDEDDGQKSILNPDHLKKSLSESLKLWYPLAGRIIGGQRVECNDEGVPFVEAEANCSIHGLIKNPNPGEFKKLLPFEVDEPHDLTLAVQATYFKCGGVSIGFHASHKILDGASFFSFLNSWAAVSRGASDLHRPNFEGSNIFPPQEVDLAVAGPVPDKESVKVKEEVAGKVFTFSNSKIADLQNRYSNSVGRLTRVEALSAFIWSRFYSTTETEPDPTKIYIISILVNLRSRFERRLPENLIGNIFGSTTVKPSTENGRVIDSAGEVAYKLREAIQCMKGSAQMDRLKRLSSVPVEETKKSFRRGELIVFIFNSLCRFPWREADFGWGKPVRIGSPLSPFKYSATFFDTPEGDGIEAWVTLKKEDMDKFENDSELRKFVF